MKVALVYDRVNKWGGAERVLLALHEIFPDAPLYTSVYDKSLAPWADVFDVHTSFLQNFPIPKNKHEYYPFLMGIAFESFNFDKYDLVISITSEFSKALITKPQTQHICYCLTPTSYLWSGYDQYFSDKNQIYKSATAPIIKYLQSYDKIICHRPDSYIAISNEVKTRIEKYYGIESDVIYPPVSIQEKQSKPLSGKYYLVVARLVPNKRIDLAIKVFNELNLPLKIVGVGRQEEELKSLASQNIEFLGSLTERQLSDYYRECIAVVVTAQEDFGIVPLEAQSYGKPVIAYAAGGALETVVEGKTGWFFKEQKVDSLVSLIKEIKSKRINPLDCFENAKQFSKEKFKISFKEKIEKEHRKYKINV